MSDFEDMCALWKYKTGSVELKKFPDGRVGVLDYTDLETYIFEKALTPKPAPKPAPVKGPDLSGPGL